jgi:hypothetical protein
LRGDGAALDIRHHSFVFRHDYHSRPWQRSFLQPIYRFGFWWRILAVFSASPAVPWLFFGGAQSENCQQQL